MRKLILIAILIAILAALLQTANVHAQVAAGNTRHFDKNGLEFDYPAAWKIAEGSGENSEYAELATENKSTQLIVSWQMGPFLDCEKEEIRVKLTQSLVERVASQIQATAPPEKSWQETLLAKTRTDQIQLRGSMSNTAVVADVYSIVIKHRFLNLVYLRVAADDTANSAWETIRTTLKYTPPTPLPKGKSGGGEVLNGRALRLPRPAYPAAARTAHASGVVVIQVLIDEMGNVIGACAVAGHNLLREPAMAAAWGAKFSSTKLSGKPVRVTGIITYNFVAQ